MTAAHFTGTLTGRSTTHAIRDGTKASGISASLVTKSGRIFVKLVHEKGKDIGEIWLSAGPGNERCLYRGPLE